MKKWSRLALAALMLAPLHVHAASLALGTQELRVQGLLDPSSVNGDEFNLGLSYGYFFADNVQAGGRGTFVDNDRVSSLGIGGYVEFNVDTGSEVMPFGEAFLGVSNVDVEDAGGDDTAGVVELRAGAKYFLAEQVAIAGAGVFAFATEDIYPDNKKLRNTDVFLEFSLRCYF